MECDYGTGISKIHTTVWQVRSDVMLALSLNSSGQQAGNSGFLYCCLEENLPFLQEMCLFS